MAGAAAASSLPAPGAERPGTLRLDERARRWRPRRRSSGAGPSSSSPGVVPSRPARSSASSASGPCRGRPGHDDLDEVAERRIAELPPPLELTREELVHRMARCERDRARIGRERLHEHAARAVAAAAARELREELEHTLLGPEVGERASRRRHRRPPPGRRPGSGGPSPPSAYRAARRDRPRQSARGCARGGRRRRRCPRRAGSARAPGSRTASSASSRSVPRRGGRPRRSHTPSRARAPARVSPQWWQCRRRSRVEHERRRRSAGSGGYARTPGSAARARSRGG